MIRSARCVHTIAAQTHGRYLIHAPTDEAVGTVCGFHGYKENADIHMIALRRVAGDRPWRLVSVQALNRFYSKGGDVVGNWMTKQDRDQAIADNVAYVAAVLSEIADESGAARPTRLCRVLARRRRWPTARRRLPAARATA